MRMLVFGNSADQVDGADGRRTSMWRVASALSEQLGEEAHLTWRYAFPNAGLARYAARCLDEVDPDVVLLHCSGYVVSLPIIDLWAQRRLGGRLYPGFSLVRHTARRLFGVEAANSTSANGRFGLLATRPRLYGDARDFLIRLGLGDVMMTVEQASEAYGAVIRLLAARERLVVVVRGPLPCMRTMTSGRTPDQERLNRVLQSMCCERRIGFCNAMALAEQLQPHTLSDGLHHDPIANAIVAEHELRLLQPLLRR